MNKSKKDLAAEALGCQPSELLSFYEDPTLEYVCVIAPNGQEYIWNYKNLDIEVKLQRRKLEAIAPAKTTKTKKKAAK
jgi:hypothetical protein